MFRSLLRQSLALPALARPQPQQAIARGFAVSAIRKAGGTPSMIGEGGKSGQVPTDENQSTGLERFELLGKLEGVDVFDLKPLQVERLGTVRDPIRVYSLFPERKVGCTGYPVDSHDTLWLSVNNTLEHHRCPECGCVYTMDFQGDPNASHHH